MKCPNCNFQFLAKEARIRTVPENSYYWGVIVEILSNEWGWHKDDVHKHLKEKFLPEKMLTMKNGNGVEFVKVKEKESTADLTTIEFEKYLEDIRMWASIERGIWLPEPNEKE